MSNESFISPEIPAFVIGVSSAMLIVAVCLTLVRILIGPTTPDRIGAVDLLAGLVMAGLLLTGIATGNPFHLQSVLGFAVVLFLGTVALARYLDHPGSDEP